MRNLIVIGSLAAVLALPLLAAPTGAHAASCSSRKTTGTILGGVGGALIGNSISGGGGGAIIGGLGGAVVGHEIGRGGCRRYRSVAYRTTAPAPARSNATYYDQYGRPISSRAAPGYIPASYGAPACRTVTRAYYDERGTLVERPMQICDR
jgi:hypothetical protein